MHTKELVEGIRQVCEREPGIIDYAPTYVTSTSYEDSLLAARWDARTDAQGHGRGSLQRLCHRPPTGASRRAAALDGLLHLQQRRCRRAGRARARRGRVLIVDYDAHHGNGTQAYAWKNERVAYLSTHQENIYPGSGSI